MNIKDKIEQTKDRLNYLNAVVRNLDNQATLNEGQLDVLDEIYNKTGSVVIYRPKIKLVPADKGGEMR